MSDEKDEVFEDEDTKPDIEPEASGPNDAELAIGAQLEVVDEAIAVNLRVIEAAPTRAVLAQVAAELELMSAVLAKLDEPIRTTRAALESLLERVRNLLRQGN